MRTLYDLNVPQQAMRCTCDGCGKVLWDDGTISSIVGVLEVSIRRVPNNGVITFDFCSSRCFDSLVSAKLLVSDRMKEL